MSDYLGPNQTRVLDSENRNFESVIYQKRKPPLSSEVNLGGKVDTERTQLTLKNLMASGVSCVEAIKDNVATSSCEAGTIVCSPTFTRNSFKFVALDKGQDAQRNIAWVNGWRVLMQGTNSSDEDNIIILNDPPLIGARVDFVFLEVWRKLLYPADVIYKHGNFLYGGTNYTNDLIDPAMGIETSLRIQVQYRIRVVSQIDIEQYPDGFDPTTVFVQGPLPNPIFTCSNAYFSPVPGDPGLWYAGAGDDVAQETLGTVDGHTYAIPLFAIRRRNSSAYHPDTRSSGAGKTLANYIAGYASDRPDNLYNDWIAADDILDLRHKVVTQENVKEICEDAFNKIVNNNLPGKMTKTTLGEDGFGVTIVQPDAVSYVDRPGSTRIAQGDGIRRIFSNAQLDQPESFSIRTTAQKTVGTPFTAWVANDAVQISLSGYPTGSQIVAVKEVFVKQLTPKVLNPTYYTLTSLPTSTLTFTILTGSALIGTSYPITIEYTIRYPNGANGLTQVPELFLEARREDSTASIALQDIDIRERFMGPIVTTDGTKFTMLTNRGGNTTEQFNFSHQMIHHVPGNGTQIFTIPRNINGHDIIGFASIRVSGTLVSNPVIERFATYYQVDVGSTVITGTDIEMNLYTDDKTFEMNKQGRGITDCWEMVEIVPDEAAGSGRTNFHIDTVGKAIIALASYEGEAGAGYAYVNGVRKTLNTFNINFPYDSTKSYGSIDFPLPPSNGDVIEVPTFVRSAILDSEGYTFFYKTLPYQGLLDSSATGTIEARGSALTTTAGSGAITDYTYSVGSAHFYSDSTVVDGTNTEWLNNVKPGQLIRSASDASREYVIKEVYNNTTIFLNVMADSSTVGSWESYTVIEKDLSSFLQRNVIDLLPTYSSLTDASGKSESINTASSDAYPVLDTRIISRVQDIESLPKGTVWVGLNTADRGRSTVHIDSSDLAPLGLGNLGLKFEKLQSFTGSYHKTYQAYVINREDSGRLYLLVVGSETDNTGNSCFFNQASNKDAVDIFELPGRPLLMRRIA